MKKKRTDKWSPYIGLGVTLLLTSCGPSKTLAPVYSYGVQSGVGSLGAHVVQKGDTVYKISQKYNLDLRGIIETNHLSPPYALAAGTRLNLPAPKTYTARGRDSLYTISRLFNTTQTELASLNRLSPPYKLASGQILKIPNNYDTQPEPEAAPVMSAAMPEKIESVPLASNLPPPVEGAPTTTPMPPQPQPATSAPASTTQTASVADTKPLPAREGKFMKPVSGKIISNFGDKADGQHNDGINIQAVKGDAVRAAENGKVVYVGNEIEGYGNMILLRHKDQYMTAYAHLGKTLVKKGDIITRGQTIGTVGSSGFVDKPQLHFEIRKGKKAIDPSGLI